MSTITAGCLFAGIGGFCAGFKGARIKTLWANENDPYAVQTFKANHPRTRMIEKSVGSLSVRDDNLEPVDILTAGFPCQSFSQAGDRLGFDDARGQLFFHVPRILKEFGARRPKILILENVPHLMHGGGGSWFDTVMREIKLADYWFSRANCKILNVAELTELPQNRERLFMVAASTTAFPCNSFRFPNGEAPKKIPIGRIIDRRRKVPDSHYLQEDNRYYKEISEEMEKKGDSRGICQLRRSYARASRPGECPTLTANMGLGGHNVPFIRDSRGRIRRLTVQECAALQGFGSYKFPESLLQPEQYKQIGNAVPPPVVTRLAQECARVFSINGKLRRTRRG